jgi:2',3'-cyclic-nucleotide 2'-phosphodiesterase (5'-nucleotidase family)
MRTIAGFALAIVCCFSGVEARQVSITILHTTDLHGHILPVVDYEGRTNVGGLARCATAIRQVRAEQPNTLLVDAGDTIQGGAGSYLSDGQAMVKALNWLRYDAWVLGNHEFDWGLGKLTGCVARATMPVLGANIEGLAKVRPFILREVDGVKVALVGLTTPGIPNWSRPRLIPGLKFADSVETLRTVIPQVRAAGAQVLVLVCHQGYREGGDDHANQILAIARNFPEVDVIIGAHTHRSFPEYKVGRNVLYCQAGYHGIELGRVDLVYDTEARGVTRRESRLVAMTDAVPVDAELVKECSKELGRAKQAMSEVLGEATAEFGVKGAPKRETPVRALICAAIAEELGRRGVKVDAVVHGVLDRRATLVKGPVTMGDVWRIVPYENTIGVAWLTPAELREVLDESAGAYEKPEFRGIWGLKWTFDPTAPAGQRVLELRRADRGELPKGERLAVAFNSYELASGGLRWVKLRDVVGRPGVRLVEYDFQTRDALAGFVRRHQRISPAVTEWWKRVKRSRK